MKKRKIYKKVLNASVFFWTIAMVTSCKKLVEVPPPISGLVSSNVYSSDATAIAAVTSIYAIYNNEGSYFAAYPGLGADELVFATGIINPQFSAYYQNQLSATTSGSEYWPNAYAAIFNTNAAIEGLNNADKLTPAIKQQLLGEAKFLRAFYYFYLVNCYGDVPLAVSTDYTINRKLARTPKAIVYQQIISDLIEAQKLLSANYLDATLLNNSTERLRVNKGAAEAMLAKVYLYTKDYADAVTQANNVIGNSTTYSLSTLNNTFLRASLGNKEAIWQFQSDFPQQSTGEAVIFILQPGGPTDSKSLYLNPSLIADFEIGDQRKTKWTSNVTDGKTTYYYPYKYKVDTLTSSVSEYDIAIRLGEVYLIRAEAEANIGSSSSIAAAISDLNAIRNRAGLANYAGISNQTALLAAIMHERRVELFTEWGNRWFDLIRTGAVNSVMGSPGNATQAKGGTWNPNQALYPLPLSDILMDPKLVQNPGY